MPRWCDYYCAMHLWCIVSWSWVQYIFGVACLVLCIVSYIAQACYRSAASTLSWIKVLMWENSPKSVRHETKTEATVTLQAGSYSSLFQSLHPYRKDWSLCCSRQIPHKLGLLLLWIKPFISQARKHGDIRIGFNIWVECLNWIFPLKSLWWIRGEM